MWACTPKKMLLLCNSSTEMQIATIWVCKQIAFTHSICLHMRYAMRWNWRHSLWRWHDRAVRTSPKLLLILRSSYNNLRIHIYDDRAVTQYRALIKIANFKHNTLRVLCTLSTKYLDDNKWNTIPDFYIHWNHISLRHPTMQQYTREIIYL